MYEVHPLISNYDFPLQVISTIIEIEIWELDVLSGKIVSVEV